MTNSIFVRNADNKKAWYISQEKQACKRKGKALFGVCFSSCYTLVMPEHIIAIDPGAKGAIAVFKDNKLEAVYDMPSFNVKSGKTLKARVSAAGVADIFNKYDNVRMVVVEQVGGIPKQSAPASFNFGYSTGLLEGVAAALYMPFSVVPPQRWKPMFGLGSDKGQSRQMATRMYPAFASSFAMVKQDGLAEAVLIGSWYIKTQSLNLLETQKA